MKKHFLTGLAILLPVVLTLIIIVFLVNLLTAPFVGLIHSTIDSSSSLKQLMSNVPGGIYVVHYAAQILIIVALFFFTVLLGLFARWFFFKTLIRIGDGILHRIPIVNKLYKTSQDIIKTIFTDKSRSFKQVVMVPFPDRHTYSLGLVSSESPPACKAAAKQDLISVFVATTPNPTSGYLLMYPREDCLFIDMRVEDAVKFIISCGVIHHGALDFVDELTTQAPSPIPQE